MDKLARTYEMKILESGYIIRSARVEELPRLAQIEQSAGIRILDDAELTDGFRQIRWEEQDARLPIGERVIMHCELVS